MFGLLAGLLLLSGLPLGLGFVYWLRAQNAKWAEVFDAVSESYDLEVAELSPLTKAPADALLAGVVEGYRVVVASSHENRTHVIEVTIAGAPTGRLELGIEREGALAQVEKLVGARELETGHAEFDRRFYVHTSHSEAAKSLLGARVRKALLAADVDGVSLEPGLITLRHEVQWWRPSRSTQRLPGLIEGSIEAGLELAGALKEVKPSGKGSSAGTRRPWVAKAVAPVASLLLLGSLFAVAPVLERSTRARQSEQAREFAELRFGFQALTVARNRALAAKFAADVAKLERLGVHAQRGEPNEFEVSRREANQDDFDELRRLYLSLAQASDDREALQARLTKAAFGKRDGEELAVLPISDEVLQSVLRDAFHATEPTSGG